MITKHNQKKMQNSKHSFRNDPDRRHQKCVTCGCRRVYEHKNALGTAIIAYYDAYGNKLEELPECKSLLELLNEEDLQ